MAAPSNIHAGIEVTDCRACPGASGAQATAVGTEQNPLDGEYDHIQGKTK